MAGTDHCPRCGDEVVWPLTMHRADVDTTRTDILTALLTQSLIALLLLMSG